MECEETESINSRHEDMRRFDTQNVCDWRKDDPGDRSPGASAAAVVLVLSNAYTMCFYMCPNMQHLNTFKLEELDISGNIGHAKRKRSEWIECFFLKAFLSLFGPFARVRYQSTESTAVSVVT